MGQKLQKACSSTTATVSYRPHLSITQQVVGVAYQQEIKRTQQQSPLLNKTPWTPVHLYPTIPFLTVRTDKKRGTV
jgi:hypothetical protein